jgi:hypothetical protein
MHIVSSALPFSSVWVSLLYGSVGRANVANTAVPVVQRFVHITYEKVKDEKCCY